MEDEVIRIVRPLNVVGVSVDERSSKARRNLGALKTHILRNELNGSSQIVIEELEGAVE